MRLSGGLLETTIFRPHPLHFCLYWQEGPEALAAVETSLDASLVCLMVVTCPNLERRLISDELIDSCVGVFR